MYDKHIKDAIKSFCKYCKEISEKGNYENGDFLSESDIKCFLYAKLVDKKELKKFKKVKSEQTSKKLVRISTVHTEVQYHLPGKSSKLADLALINEDEILISKEGYSLNGKIKKSRLIEIKHHQSLKKCKDAITKSCKKLVGQKIKKQGYVICFHSRKPNQKNKEWLKKEDINRIENKGVKIIYVTQEGDCITKPKTLLKNA